MEKFILAENIKHILIEKYLLNERYILTEAPNGQDILIKISTEIENLIPVVVTSIETVQKNASATTDKNTAADSITGSAQKVQEASDNVEASAKLPNNDEETKKALNAYCLAVENLLKTFPEDKKTKKDLAGVGNYIKDIQKLINEPWENATKQTAMQKFSASKSAITTYAKLNLQKNNEGAIPQSKIDELNKYCAEALDRINNKKDSYLIKPQNDVATATLNNYVNQLYNDTKETGLYYSFQKIINFVKALGTKEDEIKAKLFDIKKIDEFIELLKEACNLIASLAEFADALTNAESGKSANIGWGERYKKVKKTGSTEEQNQFWADYFAAEWGDKAAAVKDLGAAFVQEVVNIGFDETSNPLIKFLKDRKNLIGNQINKNTWGAVHNAIVKHTISLADIKGIGRFKDYNIILNKNLFNFTAAQITDYLNLQQETINLGNSGAMTNAIWYKIFTESPGVFLANIMYTTGDEKTLTNNIDASAAVSATFRTIEEIKRIMEQHNQGTGASMKATSELVDNIIRNVNNSANPKETAQKLLKHLWSAWRQTNNSEISELLDKNSNFVTNAPKIQPTFAELNQFVKWLATANWTKSLVKDVITKLLDIAGWKA